MLVYCNPRLKEFRKDLKNCFLRYKARVRTCLGREEGSLTEAQRTIQVTLRAISNECHRPSQTGPTPALEPLVMKCFQMRQLVGAFPLLESILGDSTAANKLHVCICFLGRIRTAYDTYMLFAAAFPASTKITIYYVPKPKPSKIKHVPLTLLQAFNLVELELSESSFRKHINPEMTLSEASHAFEARQKQRAYVHAEIQLLHCAAKDGLHDLFPYIGASKRSCFLCASFIQANGGFETRGTHGHLYSKWYVPQTGGIAAEQAGYMIHSLQKIQRSLKRQLRTPIAKPTSRIPESSIGLTEVTDSRNGITEPNSSIERYCQRKAAQESNQVFRRQGRQADREEEGEAGANSIIQGLSKGIRSLANVICTLIPNTLHTLVSGILHTPSPKNVSDKAAEPVTAHDQVKAGECQVCERLTIRTCSKCGRERYCSSRCEEQRSVPHAFTCNIGRPINTADLLKQDCIEDMLPEDPQVEEDFGFHRLYNTSDKKKLFGLYRRLCLNCGISAETIHKWQVDKTLVKMIIATFSKIPQNKRGGYYPWFLEHQYVLDGTMTYEEAQEDLVKTYDAEARLHLSPSDRRKRREDLEPPSKRSAFLLLIMTLQGGYPHPAESGPYYDFGFCTCTNRNEESSLGGLYEELLIGDKLHTFWTQHLTNLRPRHRETCTFDEFWRAYDAGKLIELLDKKGFKEDRKVFKHLDSFLNCPPNGPHPSVWLLQTYLNEKDKEEAPRPILMDYGFIECDNYFDTMELKEIYRKLLECADHLELHQACIQGKLWSFANRHIRVDSRFEKIMWNPYPLSEDS